MTPLIQLDWHRSMFSSRIVTMALAALVLMFAQSIIAHAQWGTTSGTDIYNTNSGRVGIGTTTPSGTKLHVVNNTATEATILAEAGLPGLMSFLLSSQT